MRRRIALATSFLLVAAATVAAAAVSAQEAPRTVVITVGPRSVSVEGADGLPAGPTRVEIRQAGRRQVEGVLVALKPGRTLADLRRALPRAARGPAPLKPIITFEAGSAPAPGRSYATTIDLRPGTTYVVANIPDRMRDTRFAQFTTATTPTTATRPAPVATVGVYDYAYGMPSTLPRRGVVRFENRGERLHIAVAFPLRRGVTGTAVTRSLLRGQERRFDRQVIGRLAYEPLGVVGAGTVNDVEVDFRRRGNWVFVCFISDGEAGNPAHFSIGMVKAFRVR
jgi:hypothetical protein